MKPQAWWDVSFDVGPGNPGPPVLHQRHRQGFAVAVLVDQRGEGIPQVVARKSTRPRPDERTIQKVALFK